MNDEFKEARFKALPYLGSENYNPADAWTEGANWAYEWCLEKGAMNVIEHTKAIKEHHYAVNGDLEQKLAIAIEALERIKEFDVDDYNNTRLTTEDCMALVADVALSKIRGGEGE